MAPLTLYCLGQFTVQVGQQPTPPFRTDKVRALLAYLALEPRTHRRETLAALLWPDIGQEYAQNNLRSALHRLRQPLQAMDPQLTAQIIHSTRQTITLDEAHLRCDVPQFTTLVNASAAHARSAVTDEAHLVQCAECRARLAQAAELYQGELLAGFTLGDASPFDEWLLLRREALHQQMVVLLFDLAAAYLTHAEWTPAQRYARRILALEPWREEGHRLLMQILVRSGQRSAALAQYQQCCQALKAELGVEPAEETIALYEQIRTGGEDTETGGQGDRRPRTEAREQAGGRIIGNSGGFSITASPNHPITQSVSHLVTVPSPTPHNLPAALTPFVGRAEALAKILNQLQQGARLLTLLGTGGMGKTRLAIEVGRQQLPLSAYPDGVWFVSLASLHTPSLIGHTIASALGFTIQGGDPATLLCQMLQPKQMLLILDNFEHLLVDPTEGVELVSAMLQAAPGLKILVTSRQRINLRGEQLFQVQPLALADEMTVADAITSSAVLLFVQSAQFAQADFQLTTANLATVLRICRLVQGMPLGLELAAAQVGVLSLGAIVDEITKSAEFLAADWHDLPERQRSMRAVFAWSWQLLPPEEQRVLRRMSIFAGGCDLLAAKAVTEATAPLLSRLCHKSLLQWQETAENTGRYVIHELLRQFAAEELVQAAERSMIEERHGVYYLSYVAERGFRLGRHEPKEASAEIQAVLDNVRQAWQWAVQQGRVVELDQAAYGWWQFCQFQGLLQESWLTFGLAIACVRRQLAQLTDEASLRPYQQILSKLLAIYCGLSYGKAKDIEPLAQEAIALGAASGSIAGETLGTFVLARIQQALGQRAASGANWERTIQLAEQYQNDSPDGEILCEAEWQAHHWLRGYWLSQNNYPRGRRCMEQAVQRCHVLGKRSGELLNLVHLAWTDLFMGNIALAEPGFTDGLQLAQMLQFRTAEMLARYGLGEVYRLRGDYRRAQCELKIAQPLAHETASLYYETLIVSALIRLYTLLGQYDAAYTWIERSQALRSTITLPKEIHAQSLMAYSFYARTKGQKAQALSYAEQSRAFVAHDEIVNRRADHLLELGHAQAATQQWDAAIVSYQEAIAGYRMLGNRAMIAEAHAGLAQMAWEQGDAHGALALVAPILPLLTESPHLSCHTPFPIYLTCYHVLVANADLRAVHVLQQGYALLQRCAAELDEKTRKSFLETVPSNRHLLAIYNTDMKLTGINVAQKAMLEMM